MRRSIVYIGCVTTNVTISDAKNSIAVRADSDARTRIVVNRIGIIVFFVVVVLECATEQDAERWMM